MARALTDANRTVHELQTTRQRDTTEVDRTKDQELQMTMSHLRETNRVLISQTAELSTLLARGLTENAAQNAGRLPAVGEEMLSGAAVATRFLDSAARHALCPNCLLGVTRYRDKNLASTESNVGRVPRPGAALAESQAAAPRYQVVSDITSPPASHSYAAEQPPGGAAPAAGFMSPYQQTPAQRAHDRPATEPPAVLYGGFVVRNSTADH
jgi:hypothetical protein